MGGRVHKFITSSSKFINERREGTDTNNKKRTENTYQHILDQFKCLDQRGVRNEEKLKTNGLVEGFPGKGAI